MSSPAPPPFLIALAGSAGLTLLEALVALSVLALLASLAAPGLQGLTASSALGSATSELVATLQLARSEAMRQGRRVTVCRSQDQQTCDTDPTRRWDSGWLVFIDTDRSGSAQAAVSPTDVITTRHGPVAGSLRLLGNQTVSSFVSFASDGRGRTMGGGMLAGTLRVCSTSSALDDSRRAMDLVLSANGRLITRAAGAQGAQCPAP